MENVKERRRIEPFMKQCIVVVGVSFGASQYGLVLGFTAYLLPDLKRADSHIPIDDVDGSWIVSTPIVTIFLMNFLMPWLLYRFGRKLLLTCGMGLAVITWLILAVADNLATIIVTRSLQGIVICFGSTLCPMMVGEYTSPRYRGSFLTIQALFIAGGTFFAHLMGSLLSWQEISLILAVVTFLDLLILLYIPESPSFMISKGRYEEGRKSFVWLRGDNENEELSSMIESHILITSRTGLKQYEITSLISFAKNLNGFIKKPEFYKPIIIMLHLYNIMQFSGTFILASYAVEITETIVGKDGDVAMVIISSNAQRIITIICFVYINKKLKRKVILTGSVGLNILSFLAISFYTFGVSKHWFCTNPTIGALLIHMHLFSIGAGSMSMCVIISGEIFPLQFRGFSTVITGLFQVPMTFVSLKTAPLLFKTIGLHWTYFIYAMVLLYSVVVAMIFLPETKDRTLQDIEDEFRGKKSPHVEQTQVLDSLTEKVSPYS